METSAADPIAVGSSWQDVEGGVVTRAAALVFSRQQGHMLPWAAVGLGSGVGVFFALRFEPSTIHIALVGLGAVLAGTTARLGASSLKPVFWLITVFLMGIVIASVRAHSVAEPVIGFRYYGPIEGHVIAIDRSSSGKVRLTLDQVILDRMSPARTPAKVRVSLHGDQPYLIPKPGMIVAMTGHLSPPSGPVEPGGFDFQRKAWFDQLGAVGYIRSPALRVAPARLDTWQIRLYTFRKALADGIKSRMSGREGPFAAAIVTGDRTDIDQEALADLRGSNLAHLLAISGLHMGLLTGAVLALMRIVMALSPVTVTRVSPKKIAAVTALVGATLYLGISGASIATQRAYIMAVVMLVAICLDRRALTLRAVTVAALLVLIFRPESLVGPGFQMSFAATVALVAVFAALRETDLMYRVPSWMRGVVMLVMSSAIAGFATAPYGAAHFNQMAHYGLFANLISVPVMGLMVMPGAILAAVLWPIGLDFIGLEIMRWGLAWILGVADFVTDMDGAIRLIAQPPQMVLPLITLGGAFLCIWQGRWRLLGVLPVLVALSVWSQSHRPAVLISESGLLIGAMTPEGRAFNKPRGDGFSSRSWLENDGDGADQELAATRGNLERKVGFFEVDGARVNYNMGKELSLNELQDLCRGADMILVPQIKSDTPCRALTLKDMRATGSIAIWPNGDALVLDTANARRGTRIWVNR